MFSSSPKLLRGAAIDLEVYEQRLQSLKLEQRWRLLISWRLGLAVSGGVDSMALATLARDHLQRDGTRRDVYRPSYIAFVVDHKLRDGSTDEARGVAQRLGGMGLQSQILTLDWTGHDEQGRSRNVEAVARILRYQALGKACYQHGISHLLFAHHADDQAETVLSRLVNKYYGTGLAGIKSKAQIPECNGIYGVDRSGHPRKVRHSLFHHRGFERSPMVVEDGGITIARPLLTFTKRQLVATCEQADVQWVEDATNRDPSFTLRNTIRYAHDHFVMPKALQRPRLLDIARTVGDRDLSQERHAQLQLHGVDMRFNLRLGTVKCKLPLARFSTIGDTQDPRRLRERTMFLRRLLLLVAPIQDIQLRDLDIAVRLIPEPDLTLSDDNAVATVAKVWLRRETLSPIHYTLHLSRIPPTPHDVETTRLVMTPEIANLDSAHGLYWSKWQLWDNRYWIRCGARSKKDVDSSFHVRFFARKDLTRLRRTAKQIGHGYIPSSLASAEKDARFSIPIVVAGGAGPTEDDVLLALPTVGWYTGNWTGFRSDQGDANTSSFSFVCEVRHRYLDDHQAEAYEINTGDFRVELRS